MTSLETEPDITISAPAEITASNVNAFRTLATSRLQLGGTQLSVDLSATSFIDSSGLGALISLHKILAARGGRVSLLHPRQAVLQLLELTRMHRLFEIIHA